MQDKALGSRYIDLSKLDADRQKSKEQRLMPEYIEKFFVEAYRSFGGTITTVKDRKGVWSINRVPPDLRKLPEALERRFGKIGQTYPLITFDKEATFGYSEVEFIGPGHPLFEGVVERVLREYGGSLRQGAVFYNAEATEPTVQGLLAVRRGQLQDEAGTLPDPRPRIEIEPQGRGQRRALRCRPEGLEAGGVARFTRTIEIKAMPWESIGDCGTTGSKSWMRVQREWAIAYIKEVCGEPPKGCEVGEMWEDSGFGPAATIGLCWDRMEIDDAPWDYINKAEVVLRAMDDAIDWGKLDPEDVQERFPKDENEAEDTEEDE